MIRVDKSSGTYGYVSAFEILWSQYPMKLKLVMAYEVEVSYGFIRSNITSKLLIKVPAGLKNYSQTHSLIVGNWPHTYYIQH